MTYRHSTIEINKVENAGYVDGGCMPEPTSAKLIIKETRPTLYLKEGDIEVGIILRGNEFTRKNAQVMITKIPNRYELLLIIKTSDIEKQYVKSNEGDIWFLKGM